jgi:hypothetical protein
MDSLRTAVLIHGCHLAAQLGPYDWESIVWDYGPDKRVSLEGRATMGIKVALDYAAELLIFSTGASERNGVKEGEYTRNFAIEHHRIIADVIGYEQEEVSSLLARSELDLESQNTRGECERNFRLCAKRGIERIVLVSSPWHIERCLAEALKVADAMRIEGETVPDIIAIASYGGGAEKIVILEPSHRGDQKPNRFAELGARFFRVPGDNRDTFEAELDALLTRHGA